MQRHSAACFASDFGDLVCHLVADLQVADDFVGLGDRVLHLRSSFHKGRTSAVLRGACREPGQTMRHGFGKSCVGTSPSTAWKNSHPQCGHLRDGCSGCWVPCFIPNLSPGSPGQLPAEKGSAAIATAVVARDQSLAGRMPRQSSVAPLASTAAAGETLYRSIPATRRDYRHRRCAAPHPRASAGHPAYTALLPMRAKLARRNLRRFIRTRC